LSQFYIVLFLLLGAPSDALVDHEHSLPRWYDPGMDAETMDAFKSLQQAAAADGVKLKLVSGYRSYEDQKRVYARESSRNPDRSSSYSAPPGHSEHQLGTSVDVAWPGVGFGVDDPRNGLLYPWLEQNTHHFGFVLSYPFKRVSDWPYDNRLFAVVTDFIYEPWHLRFVGLELAERLVQAGYLDPESSVIPQDFYTPWP
jgi:D-alanyl-D-alanine carboxypeptidase